MAESKLEELPEHGRSDGDRSRGQSSENNNADYNNNAHDDHDNDDHDVQTKPETRSTIRTRIVAAWASLGLDKPTLQVMCKGAIAPTVALAAYQSDAFASEYTTLGYLVAIVSILSFAVLPRAKFLETLTYLLLTTCVASAVGLLAIYCCVHARLNTTSTPPSTDANGSAGSSAPGAQIAEYNSSASAVAAIWLFVEIYIINALRARNPQLTIPSIVACIFAVVSMTYAPQFGTMTVGINFIRRLTLTFLTGLGLGTGVSLLIFPVTSRQVVFKEMTAYVSTLRKVMDVNMAFISSLQHDDMFGRTPTGGPDQPRTSAAQDVKQAMQSLTQLHGKLSVDITLAKREIAYGALGPDDIQELFRRFREVMLPVIGLSSVVDVFERITEENKWSRPPSPDFDRTHTSDPVFEARARAIDTWHKLSGMLQGPFRRMTGHIDEGLEHISLVLKLVPQPKTKPDDAEQSNDKPGQPGFTKYLRARIREFDAGKSKLLEEWAKLQGLELPAGFFKHPTDGSFEAPDWYTKPDQSSTNTYSRYRRQLYMVLYMDFLIQAIARSVADFCDHVDDKQASGKLSKYRIVVPGYKRTRKWVLESLSPKMDAYTDDQTAMNGDARRATNVYLGDAYSKRRDPDHLPPANKWQAAGDKLRSIPHVLRSPASMFGLRAALAVMSLAVIAYLRETQQFYTQQRLFWAEIMITISMTPSSGQSLFNFALRLGGTVLATISSLIIYFIVDGHTAGVLVFYFLFIQVGFYISYKYPIYAPVGMIYGVTNSLIIGYELQTEKLGIAVAESNGQTYYPTELLAPYRLATVCAGLLVAWIWTIFPWPISEHSLLRNDLSSALYLLANYYSVVQETVRARILSDDETRWAQTAKVAPTTNPYARLEKARLKCFAKSMLVLESLRTRAGFLRFDIPIGGRFPRETYEKIIDRTQDIMNFVSLISYSSRAFVDMHAERQRAREERGDGHQDQKNTSDHEWLTDFRRLTAEVHETSQEITTLLVLLSASVQSGQPLPPYLKAPGTFELTRKLDAMDGDILSVRHIAEPGYSAFAVMQVASRCISDDLRALLRDIKDIVGELDFSFHVPNNVADDSTFALSTRGGDVCGTNIAAGSGTSANDDEKRKGD